MDEMSDQLTNNITIRIAGREFPVKVDQGDEEIIRNLEKEINNKIQFYKREFKDISHEDSLIMTLLTYAFDLTKSPQTSDVQDSLREKLKSIDQLLDSSL